MLIKIISITKSLTRRNEICYSFFTSSESHLLEKVKNTVIKWKSSSKELNAKLGLPLRD